VVLHGSNGDINVRRKEDRQVSAGLSFEARVRLLPEGGTLSATADTVTISFGGTLGGRCIIAWEITGAATGTAPAHAGQAQTGGPTGTDSVSSGNCTPTGSAGNLIIGISLQASATDGAPTQGTGYTSDGTWINFSHGAGLTFARAESKTQTGTGAVAATFTPLSGSDRFLTHVAAFQEPGGGASPGRFFFAAGL